MQYGPNVERIQVQLRGSPLKNLNSYLFRGEGRNLLVDTGFNQQGCLEDLRQGLAALDVDMERTDLFLTHFHADHCGLVSKIAAPGSRVFMSAVDLELRTQYTQEHTVYWQRVQELFLGAGVPPAEMDDMMDKNPSRTLADEGGIEIRPLADGDALEVGGRRFCCIATPGHTPGHMCLYEAGTQTMVLGDHVLFDITPNTMIWPSLPDSLGGYLDSLQKIGRYEIRWALPAHRECGGKTVAERAGELVCHHEKRLREVEEIVASTPGSTGYEVASRMSWSVRANGWDDFPVFQKWFATGEALAHLEYLQKRGRIQAASQNGITRYSPARAAVSRSTGR